MSKLLGIVQITWWSEYSAAIFCFAFLCLIAWVFLPERRSYYERGSQLPLEDDGEQHVR